MNNKKRWAVIRKSTGKTIRTFSIRDDARDYKRTAGGNLGLFDNLRQVAVR